MNVDLRPFFVKYESLVTQVDAVFDSILAQFPSEIKCKKGCSDCCNAIFDVSLIEAMYLNDRFASLNANIRNEVLIAADKADRKAEMLKRRVYREFSTNPDSDILVQASKERIRCPLLGADGDCVLYPWRPITCRLYGVPMEIGGKSHTCGLSAFEPGRQYPSVKIGLIQDRLVRLSNEILAAIGSRYQDFQFMHVPVSTALLTVYSDDFFGLNDSQDSSLNQTRDIDA